jgi:hypothetical protein
MGTELLRIFQIKSYLRAIRQYRIHKDSLETRRAQAIFEDLLFEGFICTDQDDYYRLKSQGEYLERHLKA